MNPCTVSSSATSTPTSTLRESGTRVTLLVADNVIQVPLLAIFSPAQLSSLVTYDLVTDGALYCSCSDTFYHRATSRYCSTFHLSYLYVLKIDKFANSSMPMTRATNPYIFTPYYLV